MVYGSFPRGTAPGLVVSVPRADYMLALKLKAMRTTDPAKGRLETDDIFQLMRVLGIDTADQAMQVLARYFPTSAQDAGKQRLNTLMVRAGEAGVSNHEGFRRRDRGTASWFETALRASSP